VTGPSPRPCTPGSTGSKEDAIAGFLAYAHQRLEKLGVWVSADVFGLTVHTETDGGIGQKIEKVSRNVDIVCSDGVSLALRTADRTASTIPTRTRTTR